MKRTIILPAIAILLILAPMFGTVPQGASAAVDEPALSSSPATSQPEGPLGPDSFPEGVNPLTGLPVKDPNSLANPPAMISVSNFPASARPQAGLSFAPYVFEMTIGEGMTRFLAMFYGDYPTREIASGGNTTTPSERNAVGPIRSGRLPYASLRKLYNGFLVMASASPEVQTHLGGATNIFGSDSNNINSALIDVTQLEKIAKAYATGRKFNLTGNAFDAGAPQGGKAAGKLWVYYSWLNQILWTYDQTSGAYLRQQDQANGTGKFVDSTDRLTGKQLAFQNVIVLYAQHHVYNSQGTLIDIDLLYNQGKAYLFRDGKVYPLRWTTANGTWEKTTGLLRPIRFIDEKGNPFTLKPGNTWVEIVDYSTTFEELQAGSWKARFFAPVR
jgi:hypothetical protein